MRNNLTKIFAVMAMSVMSLMMWAQTYSNEPFSVTWSMADGGSSTAVVSPSGTAMSCSWSMSENIAVQSTATYGGNTLTKFQPTVSHNPRVERNPLYYVEWTFTPSAGLTFTPSAVSFDAVKCGTGDPRIDVDFTDGAGNTQQLTTAEDINRDGNAESETNQAINKSYSITTANTASGNAVKLRIYIGKCNDNKQVAFGRVVISGTVDGEKSTEYTVTFSKGETGALGTVPVAVTASSVTMPTNTSLFKEGYTLTGWTDGESTYAIGDTFYPESNTTLTPVFSANTYTLAQTLSELTIRWEFQRGNGCPETQWEGRTGDMFIQQVSINGRSTDVMLEVNTNPGKFNNAGWTDWAQVNEGTTFVFASAEGATVKAYSMGEPKNDSDVKSNVDGNEYSSYTSYIASYATTPSDGHSTLLVKGGSYYRYIDITYPANEALLPLKTLTVDGVAMDGAIIAAINTPDAYEATFSANTYTTIPTVVATMLDDSEVAGVPSGSGTTRAYTISDDPYTFTLNIEGIHVYAPTGDEEAVNIKMNEGTVESNVWTNGVYTFTTSGIGSSGGADFKFDANTDVPYTISVPADVVVKQFIIKNFHANYSGGDGQLKTVTSTGATTYLPTKRTALCNVIGGPDNRQYEGEAYDLIVTIEDHAAGTPIVFTMKKSAQPMGWIQLTTVHDNPGIAPVKTADEVAYDDNDAVVAVTFDRVIANDVTATIGGNSVKAKGGSTTLYFPVWDLAYSSSNTLTIAAGAARDNYNNATDAAIEVAVNIPAKTAVTPATYDYVVSNVSELDAAIAAVKVSNTSAAAARKTIFLKNGSYTYGTLTGSYQYNVSLKIDNWNHVYNVSLIGESKEGVIIEGTTDGITSATLNLGNGTGIYLQDLTIRNNYDFHAAAFKGVSVAVTGGKKAILKNVAMQANQDTYVTGDRTYLENCDIYGTVDFICGGGDIFFDHCNLLLCNRGGNCITAPNTSSATLWGYVFDHCTIDRENASATAVVDGGYNLGRPWQNEPRATYLHTTMNVLCSDGGWASMGNLPTHFYEYKSYNAGGSLIDLSTRQNSPSSTNTYSPVLTDEQAAEFTVHNVLGGTDAWDAAALAAQVSAPTNVAAEGYNLSWNAVDDALCYVVFKDGAYLANVTTTSYTADELGIYAIKAANRFGGLSEASTPVEVTVNNANTFERAHAHMNLNTLCFPYQIDSYTGATFYTLTYKVMSGEEVLEVILDEHEGTLVAGNPYFYIPEAGHDKLVCNYSGEEDDTPNTVDGVVGSYVDNAVVPTDSYVTYNGQIRKVNSGVTLGEYRAYIDMSLVSATPTPAMAGRKRLSIRNADAPAAPMDVENVQSDKIQSTKILRNGQLFIIRDGKTYNVMGVEIK